MAWWIKRHRKYSIIPPIDDVASFSTQYIAWWGKLTEGTREAMRVGGPNGCLAIMLLLRWWGGVLGIGRVDEGRDESLKEERGIWYEYVDNAREGLASILGRPYDRRTSKIHKPIVAKPVGQKRAATTDASPRGMPTYRSTGSFY
jgi:hypothetical protein